MEGDIINRRRGNEFGHLVWQLNEIWPTGGWGSIEYGSPGRLGQVRGGRWKALHHFYDAFLFRDVLSACAPTATSTEYGWSAFVCTELSSEVT